MNLLVKIFCLMFQLQIDYKNLYHASELALIENWPKIAVKIKCMSNQDPVFHDTTGTLA